MDTYASRQLATVNTSSNKQRVVPLIEDRNWRVAPYSGVRRLSAAVPSDRAEDAEGNLERQPETISFNTKQTKLIGKFVEAEDFIGLDQFCKSQIDNPLRGVASTSLSPDGASIPLSPKSNRPQPVQHFLRFHQERITSGYYYAYHDYNQLYTKFIHAMAEDSLALQYAMVAFAALVYSVQDDPAKQVAYQYYSLALGELQILLDDDLLPQKVEMAIATALQLASFEVNLHSAQKLTL
jgi:hypothetical protein